MSLEINSIIVGGNLANDVTLKSLSTGQAVCTFTVATNRTFFKNKDKVVETSFIDVDVWGTNAKNCNQYLSKGSPVVVVGRLKQDRWENDKGEKRSKIKVVASNVQFLPSNKRSGPFEPSSDVADQTAWDE
jgi:single-strand DNA-binding protein